MSNFFTTLDQISCKSFAYVIFGSGTAGLILAARLSEDPTKSVLVLEAGGAHIGDPMVDVPATYGKSFKNEEYDWALATVPQKHTENTSFFWPRGKGLGGSSATNICGWNRPVEEDINACTDALQDTAEALGLPRLVEPQGGDRVGFGMDLSTMNARTNKRVTSVAYLGQAGARPNLHVLVNAPVARILSTPGEGFVANGVELSV